MRRSRADRAVGARGAGGSLHPGRERQEQGALLGEKTKQLVKGEVSTHVLGPMFIHSFNIVAPTIKYRYELFTAAHAISFYPLTVQFASQKTVLNNEEDFRAKLKEILSSQHTLNVVHSILAQVKA
ncbi:MAG: hypothetical protein ABSE85_19150 [Candidatus Korobacteraceae bacterium]